MKSKEFNYFKDGKCYQWNMSMSDYTITDDVYAGNLEFCLDQKNMNLFLKFNKPELELGKTLVVKENGITAKLTLTHTTLNIPEYTVKTTVDINTEYLKNGVKFADAKSKKPVLTGVAIVNDIIYATDSFSAYRFDTTLGIDPLVDKENYSVVIPVSFINELPNDKACTLEISDKLVATTIENTTYISRIIEGNYPNLERIYKEYDGVNAISVKLSQFQTILDYSIEKTDKLSLDNRKAVIKGLNEIEFETEIDLPGKIMFALDRVKTIIGCIRAEYVAVSYVGELKPMTFKCAQGEYLLLPIKEE